VYPQLNQLFRTGWEGTVGGGARGVRARDKEMDSESILTGQKQLLSEGFKIQNFQNLKPITAVYHHQFNSATVF